MHARNGGPPYPWRFLLGAAESVLWIAGEAWLNHVAEDERRGRTVALFGMAAGAGFAVGPLLLAAAGSEGWLPFLVCATITILAALPLLLVRKRAPRLEGVPSTSAWRYLLLAPIAMLGYFVFAATDAVVMSFFPIYGVGEGLSESSAIGLISVFAIGTLAFQLPVGWLMDRVNAMGIVLGPTRFVCRLGRLGCCSRSLWIIRGKVRRLRSFSRWVTRSRR